MKLLKRERNFAEFLKVLKREEKPSYLPFYEHIASPGFIASRTETSFDKMSMNDLGYWRIYVDFWLGMGFDCIPMEIHLNLPINRKHQKGSEGSEDRAIIKSMEDFENLVWPDISKPLEFKYFEMVGDLLPEEVKIVGGPAGGAFEWTTWLMGFMGLSYAIVDRPNLVGFVFKEVGELLISAVRQCASMDCFGALRNGDDLGFKTGLLMPPELYRKHVFPVYKEMVKYSHSFGKPFILHSCGDLSEIYDELIDDCKIDAKHSFEDIILPVADFKKQYGNRVTPLGGLDVDFICRRSHDEIRKYVRQIIEACCHDGYWALGTGNSLPDYMPVENYIVALEEGLNIQS